MNLTSLIIDLTRPASRWVHRRRPYRPRARHELHDYWRQPDDVGNAPQNYLNGEDRSRFLLGVLEHHTDPSASVLEIGCNVGRNLNQLCLAGYSNLTGIEISEQAVALLKTSYPKMAREAVLHVAPVENIIAEFDDNEFDVVFTMAVLEHIHTDSEWAFAEMARITGTLLTIEDEKGESWRHFPRNYRTVFERLGMRQVDELSCRHLAGLHGDFRARVFKKAS